MDFVQSTSSDTGRVAYQGDTVADATRVVPSVLKRGSYSGHPTQTRDVVRWRFQQRSPRLASFPGARLLLLSSIHWDHG